MDIDRIIESYREEIVKSAQELIRISSVEGDELPGKPFGENADKALNYFLKLAGGLGFATKNVNGYAGFAEMGQGDETLAILVHLDVVPEGTGWTYPPFSAEIHDGRIYGRGAIDDKGPAVAALYAMKSVKDSGLKLNKKVRLIFGLDEESGWKDMQHYFSVEPMPEMGITPDGCYPVIHAEKGIVDVSLRKSFVPNHSVSSRIKWLKGGERPNMVPDTCVCCFKPYGLNEKIVSFADTYRSATGETIEASFDETGSLLVETKGISAHGSMPENGKNAVSVMLAFLESLGLGESDMENFISTLNSKVGNDSTGKFLDISFKDDVSGSLTLNLGVIDIREDEGYASLNIRYPVTYTQENVIENIKCALDSPEIKLEITGSHDPLYVPKDDSLVKTLLKVYSEKTGQNAEPIAIGGGTYARALKNAVAFGAVFPGSPELAHQKDEYIEIEELILNVKIYAQAIAQLTA